MDESTAKSKVTLAVPSTQSAHLDQSTHSAHAALSAHSAHTTQSARSIRLSQSSTKSKMRSVGAFGGKSMSRMRMRRPSYGFSRVPGLKPVEISETALEFRRPVLTYLNTYQLDPRVKFDPVEVTKAAEALLDEHFTNYKYSAEESPALAMLLAGQLMRAVKAMAFNRYRILSIVTIGQKRAQCYNNAITFLWDHERDGYINVQREVHTAFIQITLFGIYLD